MNFEDVYKLTDTISSETAYSREESEALFNVLDLIPPESTIIEVGCEFGRSTSILAQVAVERNHKLILIDPFITGGHPWARCMNMLLTVRPKFTLHCMKTNEVNPELLPRDVGLIHIDGDHTLMGVYRDINCLAWRVKSGGFACFHDYGRESLPDVKLAISKYLYTAFAESSITKTNTVGTLHIARRR